jgi:hypothetical protein
MPKKYIYIVFAIVLLFFLTGCSTTSRTSVNPWPGLYMPKETNKHGYKSQKERKKELKKQKKDRARKW